MTAQAHNVYERIRDSLLLAVEAGENLKRHREVAISEHEHFLVVGAHDSPGTLGIVDRLKSVGAA